jgi:hypothetical protein
VADEQVIKMPKDAQILCVQTQFGNACLWALVDDTQPMTERRIRVHGTGHEVRDVGFLHYIGTFQIHGGALVFHVFEDTRS